LLTENAEKLYGIVRNGRASAKRFVDYNPVRAILLVFSEMSIPLKADLANYFNLKLKIDVGKVVGGCR
jgi:hypothetical protein